MFHNSVLTVKGKYLKTLVRGRAKAASANFTYSSSTHNETLRTLQRKIGQLQAVLGASIDKTAIIHVIHSSETNRIYASTISRLTNQRNVFQSLCNGVDLCSFYAPSEEKSKSPPSRRENWCLHTIKRNLLRKTLPDLNTGLQERFETQD